MGEEIKVEDNGHGQHDSEIVKEKKKILKASSASQAFHPPQGGSGSPADHLVVAGDDPRALLMRTIYAEKRMQGNIMAIATARDLADCDEFEDELDKEELKDIIAGDTSVMGQARKELVQSITGDLNFKHQRNLMQWFKGAYNNDESKAKE